MKQGATGSRTHRVVTATFGLMFVAIAVAILVAAERSFGPMLTAVVLGGLGVDAVVSACRNTASLLSRIGPLP